MPIINRFREIVIGRKSDIFHCCYLLQSRWKPSQGDPMGSMVWKLASKSQSPWLPDGENHVILWSVILSQYQHVTDGWLDGQTAYS